MKLPEKSRAFLILRGASMFDVKVVTRALEYP
jgi:hypothetical protein